MTTRSKRKTIVEQQASYGSGDLTQPGFTAEPVVTGNSARPADQQTGDPGNVGVMSPAQAQNLMNAAAMSRSQIVSQIVDKIAAMEGDQLAALHDDLYGPRENPSDAIAGNAAASNLASISTYNEELDAALEGVELTEEVKTKLKVLFESLVNTIGRVVEQEIAEEYQQKLEDGVTEAIETMTTHIDSYASKVANQYLKENALAVVDTARVQIAESLITKMKGVLNESYFNLDEANANAVKKLEDDAKAAHNVAIAALNESKEKDEKIRQLEKNLIIERASYGLTVTQKEELKTLSESVQFSDSNDYTNKIKVLVESRVRAKPGNKSGGSVPSELLVEDAPTPTTTASDPTVKSIAESLKRLKQF